MILSWFLASPWITAFSQESKEMEEVTDSLSSTTELEEFVFTKKLTTMRKLRDSALNVDVLSSGELRRAACCNLGESFTTNPSVDVNYTDAATGARQIRLLGLPGTYVQMLGENIPMLRGSASPFGLSYIPGPWMQSIQVSKGASSVKNGYESLTGQINVEFLKPQTDQSVAVNGYADLDGKAELNAMGNLHLAQNLSSGLMIHGENSFATHDSNHDSFADTPAVRQLTIFNRWFFSTPSYILQAGLKYLGEKRESGQTTHGSTHIPDPYTIGIKTNRGEFFLKNAYTFDQKSNSNIALMLSGSMHGQRSNFGRKIYDVDQNNFYSSLMFEREFGSSHSLSTGLSFNYDHYDQSFRLTHDLTVNPIRLKEIESTPGAYAQYTFNYEGKLILMGGLRYDHSSLYGSMLTPRVHARYNIVPEVSVHASAGKGYRSPFALADYSYLLASSREIVIAGNLKQEQGWNYGGGISGNFNLFSRDFSYNAEYYYTHFQNQVIVDLDRSPDAAYIINCPGSSLSHAAQLELTCEVINDLNLSIAYRYNKVRVDYGAGVVDKPLTSSSKALFSASYSPMMGLWQFDVTLALNGGGRLPDPRIVNGEEEWSRTYKGFPTLNAQVTRNFRHWSVYLGGENLTGYKQKNPIIGADNPWGPNFDSTMIYGPLHGAMVYLGFRYTFTKY